MNFLTATSTLVKALNGVAAKETIRCLGSSKIAFAAADVFQARRALTIGVLQRQSGAYEMW